MPASSAPPVPSALAPLLTPRGHLLLAAADDEPPLPAALQQRLAERFALGAGHGLLRLGAAEVATVLPPALAWWRDFAARYVTLLCATASDDTASKAAPVAAPDAPDAALLEALIADAPPMRGAEYLNCEGLRALWSQLDAALRSELAASGQSLQDFLKALHPAWNLVGRVHFNLAENRKDAQAPFAFLATYASRVSAHGKAQHLPLSQALREFSDTGGRARLLSLLRPVQSAAEQCEWLAQMVENGEIYHPLRWTPADALRMLGDMPKLEAAGIVVRTPQTWAAGRPARARVQASIGAQAPSLLGQDALLDFKMAVTLDGEALSPEETQALLQGADGLQWMRGRWVEVDRKRMERLLERLRALEQEAAANGLPMGQAMRLLAGASLAD